MSAVLVCLAAAVISWPPSGAVHRRARLRPASSGALRRLANRPPRELADRPAAPLLASVVVGAIAAGLATPVVGVLAAGGVALAGRGLQRGRRAAGVRRQLAALAEALGVLAAELRAGRSAEEAAGTAVGSCSDRSVAAALGPVLRLGEPPRAGPEGPSAEFAQVLTRVAAAVRLSARTGCSLAAVLTAVEDDLRARAGAEAELRSAVAGPRASAAVLAGLPVLGLLMGSGVGADPWRVLTTTGTGTVLLVAGVSLETAGLLWSARLVRAAVRR
jgi:tight adherence protein B